ncbi:hypothetical protein BHE74_00019438 [Ensete ventricosum]|uniref:Uncharacterized protein n=1 Tax=Ensete ventricosum TaxID=4639 RepID=A0A427AQ18_ENSVE|nr:hypothetical protein B296_00015403 [Ensete ventricosum]RWW13345.1 hypothetical protein GW17_00022931 [Ensete ventricosum]RWW72734.1 hypothetical protein BHE74_00019438 [Ensete ventricosum]RZR98835.1 hypothetical protein BHM03_00028271 [Ensete ventricosum]
MSGLYTHSLSPARDVSSDINSTADINRCSKRCREFSYLWSIIPSFVMPIGVCKSRVSVLVALTAGTWRSCWQNIKSLGLSCGFFLFVFGPCFLIFAVVDVKEFDETNFLQLESGQFDKLLGTEIIRVSGIVPNQWFGDYNRLQHRSPSPMATPFLNSDAGGTDFGVWSGCPQEVDTQV